MGTPEERGILLAKDGVKESWENPNLMALEEYSWEGREHKQKPKGGKVECLLMDMRIAQNWKMKLQKYIGAKLQKSSSAMLRI